MTNLVETDRNRVRDFGGSMYILIPRSLRREFDLNPGDEISFHRAADSTDTIIRIEKISTNKKVN